MKKFEQFITENLEDRQRQSRKDAAESIDRIKKELSDQDTVGDHMKQNLGFKTDTSQEHDGIKAYMNMPKWKEDYTCYFFILRAKTISPDDDITTNDPWRVDAWVKVDYDNPDEVGRNHTGMKMRAQFNENSHLYAIWLPDDIAEQIDKDDNPDDYMWLLKKYKFKI